MAYTFDPLLAVDPSNPSTVAGNSQVVLFEPGDASQTPVALTTPDGAPFANPVTTTAEGFTGAFQHATLGRLAWAGGGFSNFITAHDDIKQEAVAARDAAQLAAENAAAELSARIAAGEFQGEPGRDGSNVVPTAQAIATEISTEGTPANTALNATYGRDDVDYVDQLARNSPYSRLSLKRVATNDALEVTCYSPDGQHITHYIEGDASASGRDDYRIVGDVWSGKVGTVTKQYPDLTLTGAYTATADQFGYTTQVGATWTTTVTVPFGGAQVRVYPYRDNRGGVWRYTLGGYQVDHSTYAAAAGQDTNGALVSAGAITAGVYTLKAEFLGADPLNPPAGGVPARGWLARTPTGAFAADQYNLVKLPDNLGWPKTNLLGSESNREFAWWIKPEGSTAASEWVPHHGISSAFNAEPPVLYDGARVIDPVRLAVNESRPLVGPFKLVQHVYGRHTASGATNLLEIWTTHTIHADGRFTVEGKIKVLSPIELLNTFVIMCPVNSQIFDLAVTSLNNQYPNTAAQLGTNTFLPESDVAKSYLFLSSTNPTMGVAFRYNNPADTVRRGEPNKNPPTGRAWLEHRTGGLILKHYQKLWATGTVLPAGTVHRFSGDYIHVSAPQLYQQFSL